MPRVIFNIGFTPYEKPKNPNKIAEHASERAFYNGTAEYNYFDYTENEQKVVKSEENKGKNYMEKTSGVFNQKGALTAKEKAELAQKLKTTKSIIWHGFISFDSATSSMFETQEKCIDFVSQTFDTYFKENRLEPKNMELFCSLHSDTDNRHIHFCFFEKEPKNIDAKGHQVYRRKGALGEVKYVDRITGEKCNKDDKNAKRTYFDKGREVFLYEANLYIDDNKYSFYIERDNTKKIMNAVADTEIATAEQYKDLRKAVTVLKRQLPKNGHTAAGSENMKYLLPEVDKVVIQMLKSIPKLREQYNNTIRGIMGMTKTAKEYCQQQGVNYDNLENRISTLQSKYINDYRKMLRQKAINMAKSKQFDSFAGYKTNDLTRKIAAKMGRKAIMRDITRLARESSFNQDNFYDYSTRKYLIEREIEQERERQMFVYGA